MAQQNLVIPINPDLGYEAQVMCNKIGLDIETVINYFLQQVVHNKNTIPDKAVSIHFENILPSVRPAETDGLFNFNGIKGRPAVLGGWEGKVIMADDFNAPLDDFEDYA